MSLLENIKSLNLDSVTQEKLYENNINNIEDLWILKKSDLKEIGISDSQINQIKIKLQLIGIDLNKKKYKNS